LTFVTSDLLPAWMTNSLTERLLKITAALDVDKEDVFGGAYKKMMDETKEAIEQIGGDLARSQQADFIGFFDNTYWDQDKNGKQVLVRRGT
jgi:hypothetical protein